MIYSVRGKLIDKDAGCAVVECAGVGYKVGMTAVELAKMPLGEEVMLYIYMNVTENSLDLFGFEDKGELAIFRMLIGVSGVGPKVGLGIMSGMDSDSVVSAIVSGDSKALTRCPGVGPKLAARIVLELKDKVTDKDLRRAISGGGVSVSTPGTQSMNEAIDALVLLGCSQTEAVAALSGADTGKSTDELIKLGLSRLGTL